MALPPEPPCVLIVEDHDSLRLLASIVLSESGYRVIQAANEADALQRLEEAEVAAVVVDLDSPALDGSTVVSAYRNLRGPEAALVVWPPIRPMLWEDLRTAVVLRKPFTAGMLVDAVRRSLEAAGHASSGSVRAA